MHSDFTLSLANLVRPYIQQEAFLMGPLLMEGSWHLTCLGRGRSREEELGRERENWKNGRIFTEIAMHSFPLLVSHSSEHFCSGLLVREVVGYTH